MDSVDAWVSGLTNAFTEEDVKALCEHAGMNPIWVCLTPGIVVGILIGLRDRIRNGEVKR